MSALPMKAEYGPTLGRLLAPRWHASSRVVRAAVLTGMATLALALVALALTLENAHYSHGGPVPFGFSYRGLYRVAPDAGGYVKVQSRWPDGTVKYSFAVDPLRLPSYTGETAGELPLYVAGYVQALRRRYRDFSLRGEGKSRISNTLTGYQVAYSAYVQGQPMFVRSVLLLPSGRGVRDGVNVVMLTAPNASAQVANPLEVGSTGILLRPLKTFSLG